MNSTRYLQLSGLAITVLLLACTEQDQADEATTIVADPTAVPAPATAPAFDPAQVQVQPATAVTSPTAVVTDPNPEHGQPGHRCEIPVGASLATAPPLGTSSAAPPSSPMINSSPTPGITTSAPSTTAPGMNPPHGQPGHDCAVAVGAPLPKK